MSPKGHHRTLAGHPSNCISGKQVSRWCNIGLHYILQHINSPGDIREGPVCTTFPDLLLNTLIQISVPASTCQWITNFLTDRRQQVRRGEMTSSSWTISTGSPQGCMLSLLLPCTPMTAPWEIHLSNCHRSNLGCWSVCVQAGGEQLVLWWGQNNPEVNTFWDPPSPMTWSGQTTQTPSFKRARQRMQFNLRQELLIHFYTAFFFSFSFLAMPIISDGWPKVFGYRSHIWILSFSCEPLVLQIKPPPFQVFLHLLPILTTENRVICKHEDFCLTSSVKPMWSQPYFGLTLTLDSRLAKYMSCIHVCHSWLSHTVTVPPWAPYHNFYNSIKT